MNATVVGPYLGPRHGFEFERQVPSRAILFIKRDRQNCFSRSCQDKIDLLDQKIYYKS